ncbi:MAG: hypothetical protein Q9227_001105 [Pyrenula ochraceoflavens]
MYSYLGKRPMLLECFASLPWKFTDASGSSQAFKLYLVDGLVTQPQPSDSDCDNAYRKGVSKSSHVSWRVYRVREFSAMPSPRRQCKARQGSRLEIHVEKLEINIDALCKLLKRVIPSTAYMHPSLSPVVSPRRRVLADKTTNALLSNLPAPTAKDGKSLSSRMPLEKISGKKRNISEVDDVERLESEDKNDGNDLEERSSAITAEAADPKVTKLSPGEELCAVTSSFHASQEPPAELEETFEIHDDGLRDSQLERLNATTIPDLTSAQSSPNTSVRRKDERLYSVSTPEAVKGSSQGSLHMASFVNFSQGEGDDIRSLKPITPPDLNSESQSSEAPKDIEERRSFLAHKAQLLKATLQLASYKIQTKQTTTPFRDLKLEPAAGQDPYLNPTEPTLPPNPFRRPLTRPRYAPGQQSPETRIATARGNASAQTKPPIKSLQNMSAPILNPTAYSARWASENPELSSYHTSHPNPQLIDNPSLPGPPHEVSTPLNTPHMSAALSNKRREDRSMTPTSTPRNLYVAAPTTTGTPPHQTSSTMQLSSPPSTADGEKVLNSQQKEFDAGETPVNKHRDVTERITIGLTSSVVKGEAAGALVDLMRGKSGEE